MYALQHSFQTYAQQVVANARALATALEKRGLDICTGSTDTHLVLVDLKPKGLLGTLAERRLETADITCNKNPIPLDPANPKKWSGLRLGTAAGTTRGMDTETFTLIGNLIADVLDAAAATGEPDSAVVERVKALVRDICQRHPTYTS